MDYTQDPPVPLTADLPLVVEDLLVQAEDAASAHDVDAAERLLAQASELRGR